MGDKLVWGHRRRFEVLGDVTLDRLHEILQIVMGWTDSHLHQFWVGDTCYGTPDREFGLDRINEKTSRR